MLDPLAQLFQHHWGHARSLRMVYKDLWVVSFPRCTAGPNIVGSCCIRLHTTANTHATIPNIVGATMLGVVASVCTQPKTSFQENVLVNHALPASTKSKNKWAVSIFAEWQRLREVQVPVLDCGGLFKDYDLHKVIALSADIAGMDALSLNYWLSKFVMEVAKGPVEDIASQDCLWYHLCAQALFGGKKGSEALNPLDASDKR